MQTPASPSAREEQLPGCQERGSNHLRFQVLLAPAFNYQVSLLLPYTQRHLGPFISESFGKKEETGLVPFFPHCWLSTGPFQVCSVVYHWSICLLLQTLFLLRPLPHRPIFIGCVPFYKIPESWWAFRRE